MVTIPQSSRLAFKRSVPDTWSMSQVNILGIWYADPLSPNEAMQLLVRCEERERERKRHRGNTLTCKLQAMLARFWLGGDIRDEYLMLKPAVARSAHARALLELIYGQLLISRRLAEGMKHLDIGFRLASNLFTAGDYLDVMNRHRLLRQLPLSDNPAKAEALDVLLTMARVIERMRQPENFRTAYRHDPKDTYG